MGLSVIRTEVMAATFTRPADATPYAALDAVSSSTSAPTLLTFTSSSLSSGLSGTIVKVRMETDQKGCVARFRLHLFHTAPVAINDNAPFTVSFGNRALRVGALDLPALKTEDPTNSTAAYGHNITDKMPFSAASADTNLYGMLQTLDIFTPASAQVFFLELSVAPN